jgi:hypothetical protein
MSEAKAFKINNRKKNHFSVDNVIFLLSLQRLVA